MAAENGWRMGEGKPQQSGPRKPQEDRRAPRKPAPGMGPAEVWNRCEARQPWGHPYMAKAAAGCR